MTMSTYHSRTKIESRTSFKIIYSDFHSSKVIHLLIASKYIAQTQANQVAGSPVLLRSPRAWAEPNRVLQRKKLPKNAKLVHQNLAY